MEAPEEHPDLEVVDLGVWVRAVELLLDGEDSVHEEREEEFVALGFFDVDHWCCLCFIIILGLVDRLRFFKPL